MVTKVAPVRVVDRDGSEVGCLVASTGGYIEVELNDGSRRWYTDCLVMKRDDDVLRLGLNGESLRLYGLKERPLARVRPEFFLG